MAQAANVPECWRCLLPCALHGGNIRHSFPVSGPPSCFLRETRTKQKENKKRRGTRLVILPGLQEQWMCLSRFLAFYFLFYFFVRVCVVTSNLCAVFKKGRKKERKRTSDKKKGYSKVLETSWTLAFSRHTQLIHFLFLNFIFFATFFLFICITSFVHASQSFPFFEFLSLAGIDVR